jgi:LAO/AO transport system kinase
VASVEELVERLLAGNRRALGRALTLIENDAPAGRRALSLLYPRSGGAHTIGLTGSAGSGKSTLTGALARELRARGRSLGIVAIDPTSPFSHGAILGDRIRMQDLTSDPEVFLRSMATRWAGAGDGGSRHSARRLRQGRRAGGDGRRGAGRGRDRHDGRYDGRRPHARLGRRCPGDEGGKIMEIADVLVVNKSDLPYADLLARQLGSIIEASHRGRVPPIVRTAGALGEGVAELADAIDEHRAYIESGGERDAHRREQARHQVLALARQRLIDRVVAEHSGEDGRLDELVALVAARKLDPHGAAARLIGE